MSQPSYPPIAELLPQSGSMVLLSSVVKHSREATACEVEIHADSAFLNSEGIVPVWVGVEYMLQCIAAHGGLRAKATGKPIKLGFLLGSRRVDVHAGGFVPGQRLIAAARYVWGKVSYFSFHCSLTDTHTGTVLMKGNFAVLYPDNIDSFRDGAATL